MTDLPSDRVVLAVGVHCVLLVEARSRFGIPRDRAVDSLRMGASPAGARFPLRQPTESAKINTPKRAPQSGRSHRWVVRGIPRCYDSPRATGLYRVLWIAWKVC